jgi:hypothetical protein
VAEKNSADKPVVPNKISDQTGQFDTRFLLWRAFCAEHGVPVETLPGDLPAEIRDAWEQLKNSKLKP